jgi:aryl-alcohol dehydrogenase-like predicted oxidoreductase
MEYRKLGRTGLKVSEGSLGTMAFGRWIDEEASTAILDAALDHGINLVDTANVYGEGESERILGNLLKERRHQIVLATKVHGRVGEGVNDSGQSRYHIYKAVEDSLKRLKTDYLDLYQVHRFDPNTPLEETLRALDDLVHQGKVRYIGASNFAAWQLAKAHGISGLHSLHRFESLQPEYSIISREIEKEIIPFVQSEQVGVIVYRVGEAPPEGSRLAAGEQRLEELLKKNAIPVAEAIRPLAEEKGLTQAQYALSWVLSRPGITSAILGASKLEHITEAAKSWDVKLSAEELAKADEATSNLEPAKEAIPS